MSFQLNRRQFVQAASAAVAAVTLPDLSHAKGEKDPSAAKPPLTAPGSFKDTTSVYGGMCEMCFWRCQLVGKVRDGSLVKLEGNPKSVENASAICARGNAGVKLLYDPNRLKYPMKNVGERGNPKWQRISWEEALDECGKRLKTVIEAHGPHAVCMYPHGASAKYPMDFFERTVGTPNISEASFFQCRGVRDMAYMSTFGHTCDENVDMANAKTILLLGCHFGENIHVSHVKRYLKGLSKGAHLIVVDPRFSASASKADMWLQIKPGTDTAFLLAVMNHLIEKGLYNKKFVQDNCSGFDKFRQACAKWPVAKAAKECDLPEKQIIAVAERLAKDAPNVSIHPGRFSSWNGNDFQRARALACLTSILGAYGVPGGLIRPKNPKVASLKWPEHEHEAPEHDLAAPWPFKPPGTPTDAILNACITEKPYPIKASVIWGQNIIQAIPNQKKTIEALKKQDFVLCVDILPTDVTMYADILLPEATYLERYDYIKKGTQGDFSAEDVQYIAARMPLVAPMFEARDQVWITNELAKRLGYEKDIPAPSAQDLIEKELTGAGLSIQRLQDEQGIHLQPGKSAYRKTDETVELDTKSGKIELWAEEIAEKGFPGAPEYASPAPRPKGFAHLLSGRTPLHSFSRTQNNAWLAHEMPENPIWINSEAAAKMGLKEGDRVSLENQDGIQAATTTVLKVTPGIRKDAVFLAHGYGMRNPQLEVCAGKGLDNQALNTMSVMDPQSGSHAMRVSFVKIVKDGKALAFPV